MAVHVLVGKSENGAEKRLEWLAEHTETTGWTVPRSCAEGDTAVFYLLNLEGYFAAIGEVLTDAGPGESAQGAGKFISTIRDIRLLSDTTFRLDVVEEFLEWGWPRQPHTATTVPAAVADRLLDYLG